jgi:hypothetical protein
MITIIKKILRRLKFISFYICINLRRYFIEKKLKRIPNNELLENGFVTFDSHNGRELYKFLKNIIENPGNCESSDLGRFKIVNKNSFGVKSVVVDASSEFLHQYVFTEEVLEKLKNFYGKDFYLRNNPTIEFNYDEEEKNDAQLFHLDRGLKQTSLMINLNEIGEHSTHMEYIKKSNKQYKFQDPNRFNKKEIKIAEKCFKDLETIKTTGKIGKVSIFDAGCGYHRQKPGKKRVMLHLNFTENFAFSYWNKNWEPSNSTYWFSNYEEDLNLKNKMYDLITRRLPSKFFTPKIYNKKYS